jgi:hypothetical protein
MKNVLSNTFILPAENGAVKLKDEHFKLNQIFLFVFIPKVPVASSERMLENA